MFLLIFIKNLMVNGVDVASSDCQEPGNVNKTIVTKFQFKYFKILNGVWRFVTSLFSSWTPATSNQWKIKNCEHGGSHHTEKDILRKWVFSPFFNEGMT